MTTLFFLPVPAAVEPLALQGNYRLAGALLFGMLVGLVLAKLRLNDRAAVRDMLTLRDFTLLKTFLLALGAGVVVFVLFRKAGLVQQQSVPGTFWGSLSGGVLAGIGLGIAGLTPLTALAALGSGRLYALWVLAGMLLAVPVAQWVKAHLGELITRFGAPMASSLEPTGGLWAWNSPPLWIFAICLVLALILHIADRGKK